VPSQVLTEGARMLRFLTPTEDWKGRVVSKVSLPGEWPVMLVEILHAEDGQISMTCALGVPKSSLNAFLAQGVYPYDFQELPAAIVEILDALSRRSRETSRQSWIRLRQRSSRNSSWLSVESRPRSDDLPVVGRPWFLSEKSNILAESFFCAGSRLFRHAHGSRFVHRRSPAGGTARNKAAPAHARNPEGHVGGGDYSFGVV
jgi:hypothetical protein